MKKLIVSLWAAVFLLGVSAVQAEVINIDNAKLQALLEQGVPIIDVRTPPEWQQTGIVKDSHLMMFFNQQGQFNVPEWMAQLSTVVADQETPFILICRSGNRTGQIARFLSEKQGFHTVYNVENGINAWLGAELPTVAPPAPPAN
jgi:rhodanese-related sulfurtransferase